MRTLTLKDITERSETLKSRLRGTMMACEASRIVPLVSHRSEMLHFYDKMKRLDRPVGVYREEHVRLFSLCCLRVQLIFAANARMSVQAKDYGDRKKLTKNRNRKITWTSAKSMRLHCFHYEFRLDFTEEFCNIVAENLTEINLHNSLRNRVPY